jgi:hypothetical protein
MQYALTPSSLEPVRTVSHEAPFTAAGITEAATRLRSWALIRGERILGLPFLRLSGNLPGNRHQSPFDVRGPGSRCPRGQPR